AKCSNQTFNTGSSAPYCFGAAAAGAGGAASILVARVLKRQPVAVFTSVSLYMPVATMLLVLTSTSIRNTDALAPSLLGTMRRLVFQCRRLPPFISAFHRWMKPTS